MIIIIIIIIMIIIKIITITIITIIIKIITNNNNNNNDSYNTKIYLEAENTINWQNNEISPLLPNPLYLPIPSSKLPVPSPYLP